MLTQDATVEKLLQDSFLKFLRDTDSAHGLIKDKTAPDWPASIAVIGLALSAYPVGVERGFMSRAEAGERTLRTLRFLWNSPQNEQPDATGYKGFFYHFLDMKTGRRAWQCELSTIDTGLLLLGALTSREYFDRITQDEHEIRMLADALYLRTDWQWALNGGLSLTHGWKPESGFLNFRWEGYNEGLLLYLLGLGSPTFPLPLNSYATWASSYTWIEYGGLEYLYSGPLFTHQLPHVWIDFRGIKDTFMRDKGIDYFENSRRATFAQQKYAINNPLDFTGYGANCWGITASDGPGPKTMKVNGIERQFFGYMGRGIPYGPDDGTLAPWAVVTSLPFAPEIVLPTIEYAIHEIKVVAPDAYCFKASFNPTYPTESLNSNGWVSPWLYGIDQGPIILMIENYQTGLLWQLIRRCPYIVKGLLRAGFKGGWLS